MVFDVELLWCSRCTNKCFKKFYESPIAAVWSCHKYLSTSVSQEGFFEYWILRPEWDVIWCFLISTFFHGVTWSFVHICPREFIMNFPYLTSAVQCRYCMYRTMCKTSFGKVGIRMHVHRFLSRLNGDIERIYQAPRSSTSFTKIKPSGTQNLWRWSLYLSAPRLCTWSKSTSIMQFMNVDAQRQKIKCMWHGLTSLTACKEYLDSTSSFDCHSNTCTPNLFDESL